LSCPEPRPHADEILVRVRALGVNPVTHRDGLDEGVKCSCRGFSQRGLEFRENLFDWIEVWAIGWQIAARNEMSV
jgi:hypothetical protein